MPEERRLMGLFKDPDQVIAVLKELKTSPWSLIRVHGPIPNHKIAHALNLPKSKVGYFTLAGGIIGFFTGYGLAMFTAARWGLIVGGKPVIALVPFVIVGFEFTILFAVFGNVIGLITQGGLPDFKGLDVYDPRCSGDHYSVVAACPESEKGDLIAYFKEKGGDTRVFES